MIEPIKEVEIDGRKFILTSFPSVLGREIAAKYPLSALPKLGDYGVNEETMLKLMKHVYVPLDNGNSIPLSTLNAVNTHTGNWETLIRVEAAMLEHNCSFLREGKISNFLSDIGASAKAWITQTLTHSLQHLWQAEKQRSTN